MSSRRLLVALAALIPLTFSAAAHAQSKIGYVNFQKALAELDEAKAARSRLEGLKEQKQKDLDKAQDQLKKDKDTFHKQAATMTEQARIEKGEALQKRFIDLQQNFEKGRAELAQKENEEFQPIVTKMRGIITAHRPEGGVHHGVRRRRHRLRPGLARPDAAAGPPYNDQNKVKAP